MTQLVFGGVVPMSAYTIRAMTPDLRDAAYPLIQAAYPSLSLKDWTAYYDEVADPMRFSLDQDEIVVVQDQGAYVRGLCISAPRRNVCHGRLLDVSAMIVAGLGNEQPVASLMLTYLRRKLDASGCDAIRIHGDRNQIWLEAMGAFEGKFQRDNSIVLRAENLPSRV